MLTEFAQPAQVELLLLAGSQVCVQGGAHQSEPAHPGGLQVQAVFALQPANPLKVQAEEGLRPWRDEALQQRVGEGGAEVTAKRHVPA